MLRFRVDDFPLTKPEEADRHNLTSFRRFDAVMQKHAVPYMLACIPRHTTPEHLQWLSEQRGRVEVAMHGVNHDESLLPSHPNEFRDYQTEADIRNTIRPIRELWSASVGPVTSYVPPHNVIDQKTVRALHSLGFTDVFGGPGTDVDVFTYAGTRGLRTWYSTTPHLYGRTDEMLERGSVETLKQYSHDTMFSRFVTLHWTWERNIGLNYLDEFLGKVFSSG